LGLYLLVKPNGAKLWQMAYRFSGRQKKLSFGIYGSDDEGRVSLATARNKRDEAKALIAKGIDPGVARKEERLEKATARPFASWADEWLAKQEVECDERTMKSKRRFVGYLKDQFGSFMIRDITVESVVAYLKTLQNQGKLETRDRVRAVGDDICKFADLKTCGNGLPIAPIASLARAPENGCNTEVAGGRDVPKSCQSQAAGMPTAGKQEAPSNDAERAPRRRHARRLLPSHQQTTNGRLACINSELSFYSRYLRQPRRRPPGGRH